MMYNDGCCYDHTLLTEAYPIDSELAKSKQETCSDKQSAWTAIFVNLCHTGVVCVTIGVSALQVSGYNACMTKTLAIKSLIEKLQFNWTICGLEQ